MIIPTSVELHAFLIGFFEVLCPWKPQHQITDQAEYQPAKEYHYYLAGIAAGFISLALILIILCKLGKELLS